MMNTNLPESYTDPTNGLNYQLHGDYYFPMLGVPATENDPLGRWAHLRREYLKEHHPVLFSQMMANGELHDHLASIDRDAQVRMDNLVRQMKKAESITEGLKARDQMTWVGTMNGIDARAREIVLEEIVYG